MTDCSIRLVSVFNHPFDGNLPKLDRYYGDRFGARFHLVPFYRGPRPDVIPVYESSDCFQGFFAQACDRLLAGGEEFSHVAFVADDLLLNPRLDARSFAAELRLDPRTAYVKSLTPLDRVRQWSHLARSLEAFDRAERERFVEFRKALPDPRAAAERLARHGQWCGPVTWRARQDRTLSRPRRYWHSIRDVARRGLRSPLPYPLVMGYSDLLVVPRQALPEFAHLCGVFASIRLFVETAAPTALAMACEVVRTEHDVAPWRGLELWLPEEVAALENELGRDVSTLFVGERRDLLYVHPIKLSRWHVPETATSPTP